MFFHQIVILTFHNLYEQVVVKKTTPYNCTDNTLFFELYYNIMCVCENMWVYVRVCVRMCVSVNLRVNNKLRNLSLFK